MTAHAVAVKVLAVHVECRRCGQFGRLEQNHPDTFTQRVLQPLASFWVSHLDPKLVLFEVTANGVPQEWAACDHSPDERPSP